MPQHILTGHMEIYEGLVRETWLPVRKSTPLSDYETTKYGGTRALMAEGASWPMHSDGAPMQIIFQADTDTLPEPVRDKFGGAGQIFQFFLPAGDTENCEPRFATTEGDDIRFSFDVIITPKSTLMTLTEQPQTDADIPTLPAQEVTRWDRRVDLPFMHGGPYDNPKIERAHTDWDEFLDKLGETMSAEEMENQLIHPDDRSDDTDLGSSHTEWGDKLCGWPALEQGPQYVDETWDHILQFAGSADDSPISEEVLGDGHGWLGRAPDGTWFFYNVCG